MMIPQTLGTYVYLSSLRDTDPDFAAKAQAYSTFNPTNSTNAQGETIFPILDAINQLKNIAATQAQKEHQAIQNYIKKIDQHLQDKDIPENLQKQLIAQKERIKDLDFTNFQSGEVQLIQAINIIKQSLNTYERRLNELATPVSSYRVSQRLNYRMQEDIEQFILNQSEQRNENNKVKRDRALKQSLQKFVVGKLGGTDIPGLNQELYALLFADFNAWVEEESSQKISYRKIKAKNIEELVQEYASKSGIMGEETHLQKIMRSKDRTELLELLNEMKSILHATYLNAADYNELKTLVQQAKDEEKNKIQTSKKISYTIRQAEGLIETYDNNVDQQLENTYAFSFHTATSHGNFYESLRRILMSAINVRGNIGADLIAPIGTVTFTRKENKQQKELMKLSQNIGDLFSTAFEEQEQITLENFNNMIKKEQQLSAAAQKEIKKTATALNKISELNDQFFIAHESLKLYKSAETKDSDFDDFHGRKMNILSALSKLYASPILANNMVDPNTLILYLINISNATLANNKDPLETYLSLFAGLLMFDDIKSIAEAGIKDIHNQIASTVSKVDCLHIYDIGGIYYPISVILNNLINQMNSILSGLSIDPSKTATAVINGPDPAASSETSWSGLAASTIAGTTIQIHFMAGFMNYISQLSSIF